ncbi:MAG: peptidase [Oscillatoriophycideae cyanobacterium NC_groundwater_1537_Pr4_S-0.65um_50_18]|nr:peptidase [Oscillatoriophycideae cyanobacterium NC_groundwater_1537_Pr4_S-0.65um_50_18]
MWFRHSSSILLGFFFACGLGLGNGLLLAIVPLPAFSQAPATSLEALPLPQVHVLPSALTQWQESNETGDYFEAVQPTDLGYLIWSRFPVQVYIEPVREAVGESSAGTPTSKFETDRAQAWVAAVRQAVQDWSAYLPLEMIDSPDGADIQVLRRAPPLQTRPESPNSNAPAPLPRIRSAETRYQFFVDRPDGLPERLPRNSNSPAILSHRFMVYLSANQTAAYTLATARHELGHALGIWGHSPVETDVLYFSQVRNPPDISHRDINTLKRIYQQPTRLGWPMPLGNDPK